MASLEALSAALDRDAIDRGGLFEFGQRAWPIVEPGVPFVPNWHIEAVCSAAAKCVAGEPDYVRQVINVPPGTGKSLWLCSFLPAWIWTFWPEFRSIYASFDIGLSRRDARRTAAILTSEWYRRRWPHVQIKQPSSDTRIETTAGGIRFSTSVESKATGNHAHLRVVDDPIKPLDATGAVGATSSQLDKCVEWWSGTMSTRVLDPSCPRYMVIMQRLHENDLAGHLRREDKPKSLVYPMRYDPTRSSEGDPRSAKGELLWPERYPADAVARLAKDLGVHAAAQLDQDPTPRSGAIFARDTLRLCHERPEVLARRASRVVLSADLAFKGKASSDRVACQIWAEMHEPAPGHPGIGRWYVLLDLSVDQRGFFETTKELRRMTSRWSPGTKIIEDKANGPAVIEVLARELTGLVEAEPRGGKEARAHAVQGLFQGANVYFCKDVEGLQEYFDELLKFPRGRYDDQVDATTQALDYLAGRGGSLLDLL